MFDFIKGKVVAKNTIGVPPTITVENQGLGYLIYTTLRTINKIGDDELIKVFVTLIHKEDSMSLCGFLSKEERDIFNILQGVSGVGQKVALVLLNSFTIDEFVNAVISEDSDLISTAKGIGPKLAKKIIIELKGKLTNYKDLAPVSLSSNVKNISNEVLNEVQSVLLSFGYTPDEIKNAINNAINKNSDANSEELLRNSLKYLAQM